MVYAKTSNPFQPEEVPNSAFINGIIIPEKNSKPIPKENKSPGFFGELKYGAEEVVREVKKVGKKFESGAKEVGKEVGKEVKKVGKEMEVGAKYVEEKVVEDAKYVEKEVKSGLMTFSPESLHKTDVGEEKTPNTTPKDKTNVADKQVAEKAGNTIKQEVQKASTFFKNEAAEIVNKTEQEIKNLENELKPCDISGHYTTEP